MASDMNLTMRTAGITALLARNHVSAILVSCLAFGFCAIYGLRSGEYALPMEVAVEAENPSVLAEVHVHSVQVADL